MTMTILNLRKALVAEIISRIPIKDMRSVRLTCKTLNNLTQSQSFTKLQIGKEAGATREGEMRIIVTKGGCIYLMKVILNGRDPCVEYLGKLTSLNEDSDQVIIFEVFHCEGLLLCTLPDNTSLMVLNPFLGQTRRIEAKKMNPLVSSYYSMGYVENKNKSCGRSFKILRCGQFQEGDCFEIYDFESNLWKTLDVINRNWSIRGRNGVSLKGNTYFPASERNSRNKNDHIICFDFTKERFGPLLHLPFVDGFNNYWLTLFSVGEDKLAVSFKDFGVNGDLLDVEIWITTKIEAEKLSFSKFFNVDFGNDRWIQYGFSFFEEKKFAFGIHNEDHHSIHIIGEDGYHRKLDLEEPGRMCMRTISYGYVPSLVEIKQHENI